MKKEEVGEKLLNWIIQKGKKRIDRQTVQSEINDFFDKWKAHKDNVTLDEELDFGALEDRINTDVFKRMYEYLKELDTSLREQKRKSLLDDLCSQIIKNDDKSRSYKKKRAEIERLLDGIEGIILHYFGKVDDSTSIAITKAIDSNRKSNTKIENPKESNVTEDEIISIKKSVSLQKSEIKKQPLISSVPDRMRFESLFIKYDNSEEGNDNGTLFVKPRMQSRSTTEEFDFSDFFSRNKNKKTLLIGDAGAGKTTCLKAMFIQDKDYEVYYASITDYNDNNKTSKMMEHMRAVLKGKAPHLNKLLVLDGLDEAYLSTPQRAVEFVNEVLNSPATVWVGCRTDFYEPIKGLFGTNFDEIVQMCPWDNSVAKEFIHAYSVAVRDESLEKRVQRLLKPKTEKKSIAEFIYSRPFFLTLFLFSVDKMNLDDLPKTEYELIDDFLKSWFQSEKKRNSSTISEEKYYEQLHLIADSLYFGKRMAIKWEELDESVRGFLQVNRLKSRISFVHWDFCVFLISRQILKATLDGGKEILNCYPRAFLNDVTKMTRKQMEAMVDESEKITRMYYNLLSVYKEVCEGVISGNDGKEKMDQMTEDEILKLKDEIIYFAFRLPITDVKEFFDYVSDERRNNPPILEMGIAYGIGSRMSHPYALRFAEKLVDDEGTQLMNRSWTVAYFGDQKTENIYSFREDPTGKWDISRNVRIERLTEKEPKSYRFRLFDIPLLHAFFESRDWEGCNLTDCELSKLKNCNVSWNGYNTEERKFLRAQKAKLVNDYSLYLDYQKQCCNEETIV